MDLYKFIYILSNIFLANIINRFMYLFYEKCRVSKYIEFCIYTLYFVLITLVFLNFGSPVITVSFNIISIFLFTLMYDYVDLKKNVLVTFIIYLVLCSIELSVLAVISFNKIFDTYSFYEYKNTVAMVINSIFHVIIYFLIYLKNINLKKIDLIISNRYFIFFSIFPIISIILITINFLISNNIISIIILNLSILFLNIFIFKYCDLILRNVCEKIFNKILKDKVNSYKKEIENIEGMIDFKKYINSNNYIIDGILNSKIKDLDNEIKLEFDIFIEKELNISLNDLLIIIGNLMDNAISGVNSTLKNKDKYIKIKIKYVKGTVIFNIKNSFNEKTLHKHSKLFNKKGKFNNYGFGLLTVKEIVEKYKGVLEVKFNKNNFETHVLLYDMKV